MNLGLKRALVAVLSAALSVGLLAGCGGSETAATTMRLVKYIGDVTMTEDGKETALLENMSLHSGNVIKTGTDAEADLSLDDTKFAGLDPVSEAEFFQDGKKLDIKFNAGGLYFYTTEKLTDEEELSVETSTMVVGIRGTSGHFDIDEATGETTLYLTSGEVEVTGKNPETGEETVATVVAGQSVKSIPSEGADVGIRLEVEEFAPEELPVAYLKKMEDNAGLLAEVVDKGGYDAALMTALADVAAEGGGASALAAAAQEYRDNQNGDVTEDAETAEEASQADAGETAAANGTGTADSTNVTARTTPTNTTTAQTATDTAGAQEPQEAVDDTSDNASEDKEDSDSSSRRRTADTEEDEEDDGDSDQAADTTASDFAALQAYMAMISSSSSGSSSSSTSTTPTKTTTPAGDIKTDNKLRATWIYGADSDVNTQYLQLTKDSDTWIAFPTNDPKGYTYSMNGTTIKFDSEGNGFDSVSGIQEIYYDSEFWGLSGFGQEVQAGTGAYTFNTGATATKKDAPDATSAPKAEVLCIVTGDVGKWEGYFDLEEQ